MFDGGDAPQAHLVGGPDDVVPSGERFVVALAMAPDRAQRRALLFVGRGNHRIKLKYYFNHRSPLEWGYRTLL